MVLVNTFESFCKHLGDEALGVACAALCVDAVILDKACDTKLFENALNLSGEHAFKGQHQDIKGELSRLRDASQSEPSDDEPLPDLNR